MEDAIRLPRLPPMTLEGDAGMVNDAVFMPLLMSAMRETPAQKAARPSLKKLLSI